MPAPALRKVLMASMKWVFSDVYSSVSEFLGLGSSPTGTDLTKVKNLTYRGYLRFLSPQDAATGMPYVWTFMRQNFVLITESGKWEYELPSDFKQFYGDPKLSAGEQYQNPAMRQLDQVYSMRTNDDTTGYPRYFAVRAGKYTKDLGQRYEIVFWPTPDSGYQYNMQYVIEPPKVENDSDYFIGGAEASECILCCALAAAELQEDEIIGTQEQNAARMIGQLLSADKNNNASILGVMTDPSIIESSVGIQRENVRINDIDYTL